MQSGTEDQAPTHQRCPYLHHIAQRGIHCKDAPSSVEYQQARSELQLVHQDSADLPRVGSGEDQGHHGWDSQENIRRAKDPPQHPVEGADELH